MYIPRHLSTRERYVFLSAYEVVSIFAALLVGQLSGKWMFSLLCGFVFFYVVRKLDQKGVFELAGYAAYWYLPQALLKPLQMNYFDIAPSYQRELVG